MASPTARVFLVLFLLLQVICATLAYHDLSPHVPQQVPLQGDPGDPLFLTPYIQSGDIATGQAMAKVVDALPDVGNAVAEQYAGFITVNASTNANTFFWFFPATEVDPSEAPVVIWLQGGPGSTSMFGLFEIHGPIRTNFDADGNTVAELNPHTWSRVANMIYIDNPVGSGYSFTDPAGLPKFQDDIARDLYEFLVQWFTLFPEYQSNPFFPFGESYAGKFVPTIARKIHEMNEDSPDLFINLAGLGIGDGFMSPPDTAVHGEYLYQLGLVDEIQRDRLFAIEDGIKEAAAAGDWFQAYVGWSQEQGAYLDAMGCDYVYEATKCEYDVEEDNFEIYVQLEEVRRAIHVGGTPFGTQGGDVFESMVLDFMQPGQDNVEFLLNRYPVLIYNGNFDIICDHSGILNMFDKMETWTGIDSFFATPSRVFRSQGQVAGYLKSVQNLRMLVMRNAGHMVPTSQPVYALDMFNKFIQGSL